MPRIKYLTWLLIKNVSDNHYKSSSFRNDYSIYSFIRRVNISFQTFYGIITKYGFTNSSYNPINRLPLFNPMYTGRLIHCYMLDESFCHFRGVGYTLSLLF